MTNNRVFRVTEQLRNIYLGAKSFVLLKKSKKYRLITKQFKERIMLAVTEVNGCEMCSFVHTKIALSSGMSREEINNILKSDHHDVPLEESVALIFAQHFAYTKESPSTEAVERLIEDYGRQKAELILAVCNVITMTNGMGTSMDYLYGRLRFKRNKNSNIIIELLNPLLTMTLFPVFTLFFALKCMLRRPTLKLIKT